MDVSNELYIMMYWDSAKDERPNSYIKIGVSGKGKSNANSRAKELSGTKGVIQVKCLKAWDLGKDANSLESDLHFILDDKRLAGEWFDDEDGMTAAKVVRFMDRLSKHDDKLTEVYTYEMPTKSSNTSKVSADMRTPEQIKVRYKNVRARVAWELAGGSSSNSEPYMALDKEDRKVLVKQAAREMEADNHEDYIALKNL